MKFGVVIHVGPVRVSRVSATPNSKGRASTSPIFGTPMRPNGLTYSDEIWCENMGAVACFSGVSSPGAGSAPSP